MDHMETPSQEELEKMLEKARKDAQAAWAKLTPEERAQAEARAQKMIEEDRASMQALAEEAAKVAGIAPKKEYAPKFCTNCGAAVSGGKFCTSCGSPLYHAD